jgi:CUB domain
LSQFVSMNVNYLKLDVGDYLLIYDGMNETAPLFNQLNGSYQSNNVPLVINYTSTYQSMFIVFSSDSTYEKGGYSIVFNASFTGRFIPKP